jgi:hypothetical protein
MAKQKPYRVRLVPTKYVGLKRWVIDGGSHRVFPTFGTRSETQWLADALNAAYARGQSDAKAGGQ